MIRSMRIVLTSLCLLISASCFGQDMEQEQEQEQQPARMGSHGMRLFSDGKDFYASHLPLYRAPHDYQVIYRVSPSDPLLVAALLQQQMITILPDVFDLDRLIAGESLSISTRLYLGHFERGGKQVLRDNRFRFEQPVYLRPLASANLPNFEFDVIDLNDGDRQLLVHRIGQSPSFDALIMMQTARCKDDAQLPSLLQLMEKPGDIGQGLSTELLQALPDCASPQLIHLETEDLKVGS